MGLLDRFFGKKPNVVAAPTIERRPSEVHLFTLVEGIQAREAASGFDSLSPAEQVFTCVWDLEAEINNGGFEQYFVNDAGAHAHQTPDALRAIGAARTASIVEQANSVFGPEGPPVDQTAREALIDELDDSALQRFEELDSAFLEYDDDLSALLSAYMQANAS